MFQRDSGNGSRTAVCWLQEEAGPQSEARFAESARRCGETTEHGAPSVVGAVLSDSFAEYARPRVELAEHVWRLHAVLRSFLRLVFVFIFIYWCNLMCFVHIYLAERLKSQC